MRIMQMHVTQFSKKWGLALYCTDPLNYKKKKYIYFSPKCQCDPHIELVLLLRAILKGSTFETCHNKAVNTYMYIRILWTFMKCFEVAGLCSSHSHTNIQTRAKVRLHCSCVALRQSTSFSLSRPSLDLQALGLRSISYNWLLEFINSLIF